MRDKLKSVISVDESDFDFSTHTSQDNSIDNKAVTFACASNNERVHLVREISRLSEENTT